MQLFQGDHYKFLSSDFASDPMDAETLKTSENDRLASFCNTIRGYEEFVINEDGLIISSNLEAVNVTGYEEWEVMGKHFSIFYTPEDVAAGRPEEDLSSARAIGKVFYSGKCVKKKGVSFWAKIRISVFKDNNGDFRGYRLVIKDTSHNALYNYRVKRVRDEYLNLFNNTFIGIFKFRLIDFKIILLNEKARELLRVGDADDRSFPALFDFPEKLVGFVNDLSVRDVIESRELQIECKGLWLSINCRCFPRQGFAEGIIVDITEKKRQMVELERLNQEIDSFIYHSSHDMRAPLTTILGLTHLIAFEKPGAPVQEYNGLIQKQVSQLDNLLKSLVNITLNKNENAFELIDFRKEISEVLAEHVVGDSNIQTEALYSGHSKFYSDPARIRIILKHLISNAVRYANPHSPRPFVRVDVSQQESKTIIQVEDNGIGIDDECLGNIFTMFYKGEKGNAGLGLYIVKTMVEKLNGTIAVKSRRSIGSLFTVTLPNVAIGN